MAETTRRDEASPDAAAPAERVASQRDKDAKLAAKEAEKRQEIDAEFREDVRKAAEKRDKALSKLKTGRNLAEIAWNKTKAEEDPAYNAVDSTFRERLNTVVQTIRETGNADVVGLEAFEAEVKELVAEEGGPTGTALEPTAMPGKAEAEEDARSAKKAGK